MGIVLHDLGKFSEAVDCYRRALELKPEFVAATINLGVALRELGKLDEAAECYRKAIEIQPGEAPARVIVNSRTGTVVICSSVRVTPAAVAHGSLSVTIT